MEGVAPDASQSTGTETDDEQQLKIFANHTFRLTNFDEDFAESICQRIVELGGECMTWDYCEHLLSFRNGCARQCSNSEHARMSVGRLRNETHGRRRSQMRTDCHDSLAG